MDASCSSLGTPTHIIPGRQQEGATPPPNLNSGVRRLPHHHRALHHAAPHHVTDTAGKRQWPSSPPLLLPSNLTPTGSHRPWPAGRSAPVERHCAANNFSHGRRATSGLDAAALRHVARYSEHTHRSTVCHGGRAATCRRAWRTVEQHSTSRAPRETGCLVCCRCRRRRVARRRS